MFYIHKMNELSKDQKKEAYNLMELWEDDVLDRYPEDQKPKEEFRNYDAPERDTVKEFYKINHHNQTYGFVQEKKKEYLSLEKKEMSLWE
ncbi:MAG: inositol oxygenase, partial [Saprospiraceae bacterium]